LIVLVLYAFGLCPPEDGEEQAKGAVQTSAVKVMASVFWDSKVRPK
jgi:hypothetical protein